MPIISRKSGFPVFRIVGGFLGTTLIVLGLCRFNKDALAALYHILLGLGLLTSSVVGLFGQSPQIIVNEASIVFRRRWRPETMIDRGEIIASEVRRGGIKLVYQKPRGISTAWLPLRLFDEVDAEKLRVMFSRRPKNHHTLPQSS